MTVKTTRPLLAALAVGLLAATSLLGAAGPASAGPPPLPPGSQPANGGIVVKLQDGVSISVAIAGYPVRMERAMLASRGIYLLQITDPAIVRDAKKAADLAKKIDHAPGVDYAEPNYSTNLSDNHYQSWPDGTPTDAGTDAGPWQTQPITSYLNLAAAHQISTGVGSVVAVLDTGVDPAHPALAGHLQPGYDYVGDDSDPTDVLQGLDNNGNGVIDEAYGHGTFVAGTVLLVAPAARILPMRVLDSDGTGNVFVLAQAISDAVNDGANVINLSLGTSDKDESKLLEDVIKDAQHRGVVVVAAAGNADSSSREYPAQDGGVLSVASSNPDGTQVSGFSNWGDWVDVAAPAEQILGPMPGGGYAWWAGTSMATPQVSGQVALLQYCGLDAPKRMEAITKYTHKIDGKGGTKEIKNGSVDVLASLLAAKCKRK